MNEDTSVGFVLGLLVSVIVGMISCGSGGKLQKNNSLTQGWFKYDEKYYLVVPIPADKKIGDDGKVYGIKNEKTKQIKDTGTRSSN